jgi:hypothetical protein
VDHLRYRSEIEGRIAHPTKGPGRQEHEERPDPLAASKEQMPRGVGAGRNALIGPASKPALHFGEVGTDETQRVLEARGRVRRGEASRLPQVAQGLLQGIHSTPSKLSKVSESIVGKGRHRVKRGPAWAGKACYLEAVAAKTPEAPPAEPRGQPTAETVTPLERAKSRGKRIAFILFGLFAAWFIISSTYQITRHALFP